MRELPEEVWHAIFFQYMWVFHTEIPWTEFRDLTIHDNTNVLAILCRVSGQFRRIAQGMLYHTIMAGIRDDEHERQALLARTLATRPYLAFMIRSITLDDVEWPQDAGLSDLLERRLASLNMPPTFHRLRDRRMQTPYANITPRNRNNLTTFILATLPRVRVVDITYICPSKALFWILGGSLGRRREISNLDSSDTYDNVDEQARNGIVMESYANYLLDLQELRLRGGGYNSAIEPSPPIADFRRVLLHPGLKTLRAQGFHWLSFERETRLWANLPIRIQRLDLVDAIIDAATIRHILLICHHLRALYITLGTANKSGFHVNWEINLDEIGNIVRGVGRHLLEFGLKTDGFEKHGSCEGMLDSMAGMPCLTHLAVTKENFLGMHGREETMLLSEALPASLQSLCLYAEYHQPRGVDFPDVYQEVNDEICGVLVDGDFPNMQKVTLLRRCPADKVKGGEFGGTVEGWHLMETFYLEPGPENMMQVNTYLTRIEDPKEKEKEKAGRVSIF